MNNLFKVYGKLLGHPDLSSDPSFLIPGSGIIHVKCPLYCTFNGSSFTNKVNYKNQLL